ncbi:hypothetical protein [Armatimonas rosea]|uniref:Uncharacterized protein n=1 Tax=Armatimonas rosea TaxID=685828 RepID=A0A7W9W6V5_ARMRO|nr:hypothetical protein [Armatimonas rosea]MBB6050566.1 hypothetical protein [Armatimonas rosea]
MTLALPITCPLCGMQLAMNPKAIGMGAGSWEVQCTECWQACEGVSGYDSRTALAYKQLSELREQFVNTGDITLVEDDILKLAHDYDVTFQDRHCDCGAPFSIAAKPRCPVCSAIVFNSYFHYVFTPDV